MATKDSTIEYLLEQLAGLTTVRARKMFGEYTVYVDEKVVALVCDDQLFIKPREATKNFLDVVEEAPPYPGAKPYYLISADLWENTHWLKELFSITANALPLPKPKKKH